MRRIRALRLLSVLVVPVLFAAACSSRDDDDSSTSGKSNGGSEIDTKNCQNDPTKKIEGDTIKLVSSYPQSGITAAFSEIAKGWQSYFDMVNAQGGVEVGGKKYKLAWSDKDDEYNAAKTKSNIDELLGMPQANNGFGAFSVVGTSNNIAIRDSLNTGCVPNLLAATGSPAWGNPAYPWLIGSTLPPYSLESYVFVDLLKTQKPNAKVAMLVQSDDFGAAYEDTFRSAIKGTDIKLVKVAKYQPGATSDVAAQLTNLANSGADVFFDGATLIPCPDALTKADQAGWKRDFTYVSGTCISKTLMGLAKGAAKGVYSISNIKDPQDPAYDSDAAMKQYRTTVKKYESDADTDNGIVAYGWTQAAVFVKALEKAKAATRLDIMNAVRSLDLSDDVGLLAKDTGVTTDGSKDPYMGERFNLVQYDYTGEGAKNHFKIVKAYDYEGKTASLTPKELVEGG